MPCSCGSSPLARNLAAITGAPALLFAVGSSSRGGLARCVLYSCLFAHPVVYGCDRGAQPLCGAALLHHPAFSPYARNFFFFTWSQFFSSSFFLTFRLYRTGDWKGPGEQPQLSFRHAIAIIVMITVVVDVVTWFSRTFVALRDVLHAGDDTSRFMRVPMLFA